MSAAGAIRLDAVILGGGAAGLWLLDEMARRDYAVLLLEAGDLGAGQTITSQGILHGGLKYSLGGLLTGSARTVKDMPIRWRRSLAGESEPDLTATRLRASFCHLWHTGSVRSRASMLGSRLGLRVVPRLLRPEARPGVLARCPGQVARLDEQVIEPASFLETLARRNRARLLSIDASQGLGLDCAAPGSVTRIRLSDPASGMRRLLEPRVIVFTAGTGGAALRRRVGLVAERMQRRPLHMVMARGPLPELNGHCVDGATTRATITTTRDTNDRCVWQIGGRIAEVGASLSPMELIGHARSELAEVLPGVDFSGAQWATHRVDRAEAATLGGRRPDDARAIREGNTITGWPTKLVLAPRLAELIIGLVGPPATGSTFDPQRLDGWPRPIVALPPWETVQQWSEDV